MIAIVDYRAGNLASVKKALDVLGAESAITSDPDAVRGAEKIILPGVGHFASTQALDELGLRDAASAAIRAGRPFLGICVGMQWMYEGSAEAPEVAGLGLFAGRCERFPAAVKSPHVGWNQVCANKPSRMLRGVKPDAFVYYTHSYYGPLIDPCTGITEYGVKFAAVVEQENVFGVQFHPEKSADAGLQVLRNFVEL
ncbi:MAG: imidazole glycerol phosphate synthase subunit HisH [Candidatus Acidiferrales bacterium]